MNSRVFVVQRPSRYDSKRRGWVSKYDLTPAKEYGDLVYLLRPGNIYRDRLEEAMELLKSKLSDFGPSDYILALGDPVAIGATVMVASGYNDGSVNLLKFDRMENRYESFFLRLNRKSGSAAS